jgi:hypothetical protein
MKKSIYECVGSGVSRLLMILCVMALSVFASNSARAQSSAQDEMSTGPTAADHAAVANAKVVYRHARPANTPAGRTLTKNEIAAATAAAAEVEGGSADTDDQLRFEGDLSYLGGAVVQVAASHAIYLLPNGHCSVISTCWGNPEGFLRDLEVSEFIHLADQYTGTSANNRYSVGKHAMISYKPGSVPLTDADVQAFVHKVASTMGVGYGNIYHVFLPPGQDECFTPTDRTCYSPDVPSTFFFCGYHSSVDFKDIGHVLYTVEPFQNVDGCSVRPGTSNGQLIDSTDNTLSHETFETITDPDGNAWFNLKALALQGAEIGDECSFVKINFTTGAAFFDPSIFVIGVHRYGVQPEYTNAEHACASNP